MKYKYEVSKTVNKIKVVEERELDITPGTTFSGEPLETETELRRVLRLPLTKPLVCYRRDNGWIKENVDIVEITETYPEWFIVKVNGRLLHSAFLSEMQKPDFAEYMEESYGD